MDRPLKETVYSPDSELLKYGALLRMGQVVDLWDVKHQPENLAGIKPIKAKLSRKAAKINKLCSAPQ